MRVEGKSLPEKYLETRGKLQRRIKPDAPFRKGSAHFVPMHLAPSALD